MLCTFCGTDNRTENKFCGMCGVRLERRKVERRIQQSHASPKCPSCEHVNEQGYKFCAMCGARVERRISERRVDASEQPRATAIANAQIPGPDGLPVAAAAALASKEPIDVSDAPTPSRPAFTSTPPRSATTIGGPSFLGLSDDPHDADYLLEEEGSSGGVLRKLVLLAVLAAVAGLVFVQWRSGFPIFHRSSPSDQAKSQPLPSVQDHNESSVPAATAGETKPVNGLPDLTTNVSVPGNKSEVANDVTAPGNPNQPSQTNEVSTAKRSAVTESPQPQAKPSAVKSDQETPSPMLLRAQQYLQGTGGLSQNCEQGLVYLRAAAKSEAAAAVQMGTLYASGHCVQPDRVAAYRWLRSAHELQPGNPRIQITMDQLWALMTPKEQSQIVR